MKNEQEFTQFVHRHRSTIYTICYMFSDDQDTVDDLFQEVLIKLWLGWQKFRGETGERAWVYRVALNTCISLDRKRKSRSASLFGSVGNNTQIIEGVNFFDTADDSNRQVEMLHSRIIRLKPFDRAIVLLWLEDLSYEEIGAIVGINAKNVSVRLARIREQLKKM